MPRLDDLAEKLAPLLGEFLPRQRWFAGHETPTSVAVTTIDSRDGDPAMVWYLLDATDAGGGTASYQVVLGGRPVGEDADFLQGKARVTVGEVDGWVWYDALVDPDLALAVLARVAPDEQAEVARPLVVEQSNTSVVYDERLILKMFRRVHPEPNPDVEITEVLGERGFPHVVPQLAELRYEGADLAVVRQYLLGSTDAWQLAHTSLRDLLGTRVPPDEAGGDFGPEAATLGEVTGRLHLALAEAFGTGEANPQAWLAAFRAQLARLPEGEVDLRGESVKVTELVDAAAIDHVLVDLVDGRDPGPTFRIHGDLHLGQFLLADAGWFVLDFEGEPVRPVAERQVASSPLRDVAGMVRSFHYAARTGLAERGRDVDDELVALTEAWETRAVGAFWSGYQNVPGIETLLPQTAEDRSRILRAFELDKAVYEIIYEVAHRPDWVDIPASAVRRALVRAPPDARPPRPLGPGGPGHRDLPRPPPGPRGAPRPRPGGGAVVAARRGRRHARRQAHAPDPRRRCIRGAARRRAQARLLGHLDLGGRRRAQRRRSVAVLADARRPRHPPDRRGPPRPTLEGARRQRPRAPGDRRHRLRGVGAGGPGGAGGRRLERLGRPGPPDAHAWAASGVWEIFVPEARHGHRYKFEILGADGVTGLKADPLARASEMPPGTASVVFRSTYEWGDAGWMAHRAASTPWDERMAVYEVHLGSWMRHPDGRSYGYRELAERLADHVADLGFTHVELLPPTEHPYVPSWGYQVTSYFAPTARYGDPDGFRDLVDHLHRRGIGVIVDWVPAHFPRDEWALARFDGTRLYEHADPRQGEHPDWGTLVFN